MAKKLLATLVLGLILGGCAAEQSARQGEDGETYGTTKGNFRSTWWGYAERGSSYLAGKFYAEAKTDLEKALEGRSEDSWRARTYGLHFVEYFPNRELGIVEFHLGNLEAAEAALKASLEQVDTERAHYYLDLVRREKIAKGTVTDSTEPELAMVIAPVQVAQATMPAPAPQPAKPEASATPEPAKPETPAPAPTKPAPAPIAEKGAVISTRELTFEVDTKDDVGVAEVTVNAEKVYQRGATESGETLAAKKEVVLDEGTHKIEVAAKDLSEKEVKKEVEVTVDLTGPTIGVFSPIEPTVTDHGTVILEGSTVDKNGVVSVSVDQKVVKEAPGSPKVDFNSELPLAAGENTFVLAARDVAGNETRSAIKVFQGDPESAEAKLWLLKQKHPELLQYASAAGLPLLDLTFAVDDPAAAVEGGEIRLKSPKPDQPYRHNRTLRVSGEVVTQTKVTSLSINGTPVDELTGAPKESFNRRLPIETSAEGESKIAVNIEATDESGKKYTQTFDVDVRPVELSSKESRMPVAVLAFAGANIDAGVTDNLRLATEAEILAADRFRVVDRTRLQDVLTEQQLSAALADPNEALALGKLTNAFVFLVADVFPHDQAGLEIKARLIDAGTSDLIATLDSFIDDKNDTAKIEAACKALSEQLSARYPRLSGEVTSVRGTDVLVNWTKEDEVQEGAYFLFVQEQEPWKDETTGEVLEPGEFVPVGRGRILSFLGSGVKAQQVQTGEEGATIEQGMPAITM
jgi:hypothetical protein